MVHQPSDQERIRLLLSDTVMLLCKNGLSFRSHFSVDAVIGITLDESDVFLVSIRETVRHQTDSAEPVQHDIDDKDTVQHVEEATSNTDTSRVKFVNPDEVNDNDLRLCQVKTAQPRKTVKSPSKDSLSAASVTSSVGSSAITTSDTSSAVDYSHADRSSLKSTGHRSEDIVVCKPSKQIRLADSCEDASGMFVGDGSTIEVMIKSEPVEERDSAVERSCGNSTAVYNIPVTSVGLVSVNKSYPSTLNHSDAFGFSKPSFDCNSRSRDRSLTKFNLAPTACASRPSPTRPETSIPFDRSPTSLDCLNLSRRFGITDFDLTSSAGPSQQIFSPSRVERSKAFDLSASTLDDDRISVRDEMTFPHHLGGDQHQQWSMLCAESALKFPWSTLEASENINSLKDLQYFSEDIKPAADLYRNSLDWSSSVRNIFPHQPSNYPQFDEQVCAIFSSNI